MEFPEPNERGVYCKSDAIEHRYEDLRLVVTVHVLQVDDQCWIQAVSFRKKAEGGGGTMGMGSPLTRVTGLPGKHGQLDAATESEALASARLTLKGIIANGLSEAGGKSVWASTWNCVETWAFSIGRQRDLFEGML